MGALYNYIWNVQQELFPDKDSSDAIECGQYNFKVVPIVGIAVVSAVMLCFPAIVSRKLSKISPVSYVIMFTINLLSLRETMAGKRSITALTTAIPTIAGFY